MTQQLAMVSVFKKKNYKFSGMLFSNMNMLVLTILHFLRSLTLANIYFKAFWLWILRWLGYSYEVTNFSTFSNIFRDSNACMYSDLAICFHCTSLQRAQEFSKSLEQDKKGKEAGTSTGA